MAVRLTVWAAERLTWARASTTVPSRSRTPPRSRAIACPRSFKSVRSGPACRSRAAPACSPWKSSIDRTIEDTRRSVDGQADGERIERARAVRRRPLTTSRARRSVAAGRHLMAPDLDPAQGLQDGIGVGLPYL